VRASALAVLRLIASSSLVGRRTGRSASFAPLRTLGAQLGPKSDIALLLFCAASGLMHCNINASGRTGCVRRSSTCLCLLRGGAGKRSELLTKNEARRIATNTAKLPELLRRRPSWGTLKNENRVASRSLDQGEESQCAGLRPRGGRLFRAFFYLSESNLTRDARFLPGKETHR